LIAFEDLARRVTLTGAHPGPTFSNMGRSAKVGVFLASLACLTATAAAAADSPVGTWVKNAEGGEPQATMTIESWGIGDTRLSYPGANGAVATVASRLDGADSPVLANGEPTPATVAIKLLDEHHARVVSKINLQTVGTSRWSFSRDFKTLTVANDFRKSLAGTPAGKSTETWTRK
jgi:hypothetical protein